jgi:hypothetical protein
MKPLIVPVIRAILVSLAMVHVHYVPKGPIVLVDQHKCHAQLIIIALLAQACPWDVLRIHHHSSTVHH